MDYIDIANWRSFARVYNQKTVGENGDCDFQRVYVIISRKW